MASKYTKAVTSWVSVEVYDQLIKQKQTSNLSIQQVTRNILESHFKNSPTDQAFKELQIQHIKNKFRLQKLYELIEKHPAESPEKYQKMVEEELQKIIHS